MNLRFWDWFRRKNETPQQEDKEKKKEVGEKLTEGNEKKSS
jgi:hypothetical protein